MPGAGRLLARPRVRSRCQLWSLCAHQQNQRLGRIPSKGVLIGVHRVSRRDLPGRSEALATLLDVGGTYQHHFPL
jgi:hypothetical protein